MYRLCVVKSNFISKSFSSSKYNKKPFIVKGTYTLTYDTNKNCVPDVVSGTYMSH